jgi:hypothetical protein
LEISEVVRWGYESGIGFITAFLKNYLDEYRRVDEEIQSDLPMYYNSEGRWDLLMRKFDVLPES